MNKIFKIYIILLLIMFNSCEDNSEQEVQDNSEQEVQWEYDPLIGGSDIVENGIRWYISKIEDSQSNWCGGEADYYCGERLSSEANLDESFRFKNDGTFEVEAVVGEDSTWWEYYGGYWETENIYDTVIGSWKTLDDRIILDLSTFENKTNTTDYFFGRREYQYSTDVNDGTLLIFDNQTEILFRVSSNQD